VSERNTGLFILGHLDDDMIRDAFQAWPEFDPAHFSGEEEPRVGRADWHGHPYTHVALRLFEVAGLRLMDDDDIPSQTDLEMILGSHLSKHFPVIFGFYEDETMAGGGARFESGALVYRVCVDGREAEPVRRSRSITKPIEDLDPSDWIWPHATEALNNAFGDGFTPTPSNDDDLEKMILAADAEPLSLADLSPSSATSATSATSAPSPPSAPTARRRDRLKARLRGLFQR
jgi:hypothetical protein